MELSNISKVNTHSFFNTRTRNGVGSVFCNPELRTETVGGHDGFRNPRKKDLKKIEITRRLLK